MKDFFPGEGTDPEMSARLGLSSAPRKTDGKKPWWKKKRWWLAGAAAATVAVLAIFGGHPKQIYTTQPVTKGDLTITVSATGTLAPQNEVTVGAEVSGRIDKLYVDFNDPVRRGEKLAQINTDTFEANLNQNRALLAQAQATRKEKEADFKRKSALMGQNALSREAFETARGDYERAKAAVAQYAASVKAYAADLTKTTIYSPIDGVVLDRKVEVGQTVAAAFSTPELFVLATDLRKMKLEVNIDEADVGQVRAGEDASFSVDAYPDKTFEARLSSVHYASETVQNVVTYKGVLSVDNPRLLLKPGMTATAEIVTGRVKNVILVPSAALRFVPAEGVAKKAPAAPIGAGFGRVWTVADKKGTLKPHDLKLGGSNGRLTVVLSGDLKVGDKVVTDAQNQGGASISVGG